MNMAVSGADATMRRLYAKRDRPRPVQAAERRVQQQPQDGAAWCFWGIGELMQLKGGPDKLLRASLLGEAEAGLWLGILQEFSAHPPGTIPVSDFPSQIELARLRRSFYLDYPQDVHIETLAICNAACTFCPYPTMDRQGDWMSDELIDKIIDDLIKIPAELPFNIAPFKVNDPFPDKRIFAVCAKLNQRLPNAQLRLFTNGSPLTDGQVRTRSERRIPGTGCFRWFELSIMASGKVALCCMDGEGNHLIGDVNTQSVLDIYNSPGYRKMRQFTFLRKAAARPCDTCVYF